MIKQKSISLVVVLFFLICFPVHTLAQQTIELVVKERDCLFNISEKYLEDTGKWPVIAKYNRISNPNLILPGQKLVIPAELLKGTPMDGLATFVKGDVSVRTGKSGEWFPLVTNQSIPEGSTIRTGRDGYAEITFKNGSSFQQRPNTELGLSSARDKGGIFFLNRLFLVTGKIITTIKRATGIETQFQVDTPSAVAAARGTEFRSSSDTAKIVRVEVLDGSVEVKGKKKIVSVAAGEGTMVKWGKPPVKPVKLLSSPEMVNQQETFNKLPLRFIFAHPRGTSLYRVSLSGDTAMRDIRWSDTAKPSEPMVIRSVPDGTYFLQAASIDAAGLEGIPFGPVAVKVRVNPMPPFIKSPTENGEVGGKTVSFQWLKVRDAVSYNLQVARDNEFKDLLENSTGIADILHAFKVPEYGQYYFRVSSVAQDGYIGAWSDAIRFTVSPPPPTPSVEKPRVSSNEIYVRWQDLGTGFSYRFQMSKDEGFTNLLHDKKTEKPEIIIPKPDDDGTYYIRTSSINHKGFESDYSGAQVIEISGCSACAVLGVFGTVLLILLIGGL